MGFWTGSKGKHEQISTLAPNQRKLNNQLQNSANSNGGAFNQASDYYSGLLNDENNSTYQQMAAPEQRQFREQIIPDLAEQFSGHGGIGSSGFTNAAVGAGTDLSERLGAIRANLRSQGAQGLERIGQAGLQKTTENVYHPGTEGFLQQVGKPLVEAGLNYATGGAYGVGKAGLNFLQPKQGQ